MRKINLGVNIDHVATVRNARGENYPDLNYFANKAIDLGVDGITLHPRPDHRHATSVDAINISKICKDHNIEFNLEGNPFSLPDGDFMGFHELCVRSLPSQVTLVPDDILQITSDHGWQPGYRDAELKDFISSLKENHLRTSLFIDANSDSVEYAAQMGFDRIEIYTGPFADFLKDEDFVSFNISKDEIAKCIKKARSLNLGINAGHDLNLNNLPHLIESGNVDEVSIGHAIIVDSLHYGYEETIKKYLKIIRS